MKVIIAGSRSITDPATVAQAIQESGYEITEVVSGRAHGADMLGEQWANRHGVLTMYFPADWERYGKQAGFRRNFQMAAYADAAIVVWNGVSRGSRHMIFAMHEAKKPVFVFRPAVKEEKAKPAKWKPIQVPDYLL